jgi:hypothetical protein
MSGNITQSGLDLSLGLRRVLCMILSFQMVFYLFWVIITTEICSEFGLKIYSVINEDGMCKRVVIRETLQAHW